MNTCGHCQRDCLAAKIDSAPIKSRSLKMQRMIVQGEYNAMISVHLVSVLPKGHWKH